MFGLHLENAPGMHACRVVLPGDECLLGRGVELADV
jgi:hypothetical protein